MHLLRRSLVCLCSAMILIPSLSLAGVSPAYVVDPCDDAYFGIHGAPDLSKALRCYEAKRSGSS
jgi:hypothetical protein